MRIRNDLVSIKIGKKQYDFNNLILNEYLNRFVKSQLDKDGIRKIVNDKELSYCLLKFDISLDINKDTELDNEDFDVVLLQGASNIIQEISENEISIKYTYKSDWIWGDYHSTTGNLNNNNKTIKDFYGKKITAIGFNSYFGKTKNLDWRARVCAVLDVSNYNIYLQENQDFTITRKDIISSDAKFWCEDKRIKGPTHLAPLRCERHTRERFFKNSSNTI